MRSRTGATRCVDVTTTVDKCAQKSRLTCTRHQEKQGSGKLTVKVPWKFVCSQAVNRVPGGESWAGRSWIVSSVPMRCPEESRRQRKAGSSLRDFREFSLESVAQLFPPSTGRIGQSKNSCDNVNQGTFSQFWVSHVKAAQRTKALQLPEDFLVDRHTTRPHL